MSWVFPLDVLMIARFVVRMNSAPLVAIALAWAGLTACSSSSNTAHPTGGSPPEVSRATPLIDYLNSPEGRNALDRRTRGAVERFNRVTLLHLGKNSTPVRHRLIEEAKNHIFMTVPYWFADAEGKRMLRAFQRKRAESPGFDFRVMEDWTSPAATKDFFATKMFADIKEVTGGNAILWNELWTRRPWSFRLWDNRMHDKMFIVDGEKLVMGGMNIQNTYLRGGLTSEGWHDTDLLIEGKSAQDAQAIFVKNWLMTQFLAGSGSFPASVRERSAVLQSLYYHDQDTIEFKAFNPGSSAADFVGRVAYRMHVPFREYMESERYSPRLEDRPQDGVSTRLIYDNPLVDNDLRTGRGYSKTRETLEFLFSKASDRIRVILPYLTLTPEFKAALISAAKRNVRVEILTNSRDSHDLGAPPYYAALSHYDDLLKAGIKIFEWSGHGPLMTLQTAHQCVIPEGHWPGHTIHSKVVVIDAQVSLVGSHNMNTRSEKFNTELTALVLDTRLADELDQVFDHDLDAGKAGEKLIPCGDKSVVRQALAREVTTEWFKRYYKENRRRVNRWSRLQSFM